MRIELTAQNTARANTLFYANNRKNKMGVCVDLSILESCTEIKAIHNDIINTIINDDNFKRGELLHNLSENYKTEDGVWYVYGKMVFTNVFNGDTEYIYRIHTLVECSAIFYPKNEFGYVSQSQKPTLYASHTRKDHVMREIMLEAI